MTEVRPLKSIAGAGNARTVGEFAPGDVMDPVYVGITGAATTILTSNLTAGTVLISDGNGKIAASSTTTTELSYLNNVTSDLQAQIDSKAVREAGQIVISANYVLVLSDSGKQILHPLADTSNRTVTIPANASVPFPINTEIWFVNQVNTLTIAIASDTLRLAGTTTNGNRSLAANGVARAVKVSATVWYIMGWGLS